MPLHAPSYFFSFNTKEIHIGSSTRAFDAGQRFALREGGRTVDAGVISKVLS
jgi:translation elongation factor EF-Tu-like GTPase